MRDLLLIGLFPVLLFYAIKRPFIGLALWLWTSLVPMQTWAFSFATSIRWNLVFALATIFGYLIMKDKPKVSFNGVFILVTFLLFFATLSSFFHQGFDPLVWQGYERFFKAYLFFVFVYLIVDKKMHVEALMWACVLSITATAAKQGFKVLFSGGGHVVYGMSSTFNDNNLSAFATLVCIPLTLILISFYKQKFLVKVALFGAIAISILFVLGSDSRGGFLGLIVLAFFYFINSKNKVPILFGGVVVGAIGISLMDASWFERMNSIADAGEDSSFMGRVTAWKLSVLMAIKSPIWGGGFDAIAFRPTWESLLPYWNMLSFIPTPYPSKGHVAHSIYFQVLGDLGFIAFFIFFAAVLSSYNKFARFSKDKSAPEWIITVSMFCKIAIICFLVAGAALSVAYNEIVLMLMAVAAKIQIIHARHLQQKMEQPPLEKDKFDHARSEQKGSKHRRAKGFPNL